MRRSLEAAQTIYNKHGWLNGNLSVMRRLDTGNNTGIMLYMDALVTADRMFIVENIPNMRNVRAKLKAVNWDVCKGLISPEQALIDLQRVLQAELDDMFKVK